MINVNSCKLIIVVWESHYLVLLIFEFLPARLATLPYGLDSNVTQLLANLLTKPSVLYYLPIVSCNLVSIKLLLLLLLLLYNYFIWSIPWQPDRSLHCPFIRASVCPRELITLELFVVLLGSTLILPVLGSFLGHLMLN